MKKYIYFIFILAILLFFGDISYIMWSAKQAANKYLELAFNGKKEELLSVCQESRFADCMIVRNDRAIFVEEQYPSCEEFIYYYSLSRLKLDIISRKVYCYYNYTYSYKGMNEAGEKGRAYSRTERPNEPYIVLKKEKGVWQIIGFYEGP